MGRVKRALQRRGFQRSKNKQEAFLALFLGMFLGYLFSYAIRQHFSANLKVKTVCRRTGTRFEPKTRPGNLSTELAGRRTFLLIGIMTADHLLATRAKTIHSTWGNEVNSGKVLFFSGGVGNAAVNFTVVRLPGVDDGYPPQRKSFHMLRYLYDHYIDNFHWFVRADDDVYVRTERLSALLRTLNSSDDLVIGQAGTGKPQEKGRLGLQQDDNFCLGGPGVVMSQSVLRKVAPYLSTCLNETVSLHEDVELSRCVRRYVGVICPWAQETHHLFNQIFGNSDLALSHDLDKQVVTRAITIHPVKKPTHMYRLHYNFLTLAVQLLQDRSANVHRRFQRVKMLVKDNRTKAYQKANFNGRLRRNSSVYWEFFNLQNLFGLCESPVAWIRTQNGLKKFLGGVITEINLENQKLLKLPEEYKKMNLGYMRSHPTLGMQFTVDLETLVKPSVPNAAEMPRYSRHYLHFQQSFAPMLARTVLPDDNSPVVHFIVPLAGRLNTFVRFLNSFEGAFLTQGKPVTLLIVFFSNVSSSERHRKVFDNFHTKHPKVDLKWSEIVGEFSRAQALELGANSFGNDELLFFADVDLDFTTEFHHRCEMNIIPGKRVYFPIMFSQFDSQIAYHQKSMPPEDSRELKKRAGTWRKYSYGPVCVYASDVRAVGGLKTTIRGWGMEDLDFHEKCLKHELDAFRVPELGLVHVYHPQTSCLDSRMNVDQAKMCNDSRLQGLASAESLVEYMLSKGYE